MSMDVKAWRKSANDKNYPIRIGSAWVDKKGVTQIDFDALPIPDKDGRVRAFLEPRAERGANDDAPPKRPAAGQGRAVDDDEIPF